MKINTLTKNKEKQYSDFLLKIHDSLFYASLKYRSFLKDYLACDDEYFLIEEKDQIKGVLPILKRKTERGVIINSLPYYGSNGGIIASDDSSYNELLRFYEAYISAPEVIVSCLTESPFSLRNIRPSTDFEDYRIGQITTIPHFDDQFDAKLFEIIDSSARRNIRKAQSSQVKVHVDNSLEAIKKLYEIHFENITSIGGKAKELRFFEMIPSYFVPEEDYNVYVASIDGKIVSALLLFYFNKTVEYFTPATIHDHRNAQPIAEVLRVAFADAAKRGFTRWNWGGTWITQDGVYKFKAKWGAKDYRYDYFIKLNDKSLLELTPQELLSIGNGFYTVPFRELRSSI